MIIPASTAQSVATRLAEQLNEELAVPEITRFADGEFKLQLPTAADRAVIVCATTTADAHIELLQLQEVAAREAKEVITVLPYMGYARQDRAFRDGEPVTARAMAKAISTTTDRVLTVSPHEPAIAGLFDVPCAIVDGAPRLAEGLPEGLTDPLFLAPDEGATTLASTVRDAYGSGKTDYFEKHRDRDTGAVSIEPHDTDVADRDVILTDDIIATGSTMARAIEQLNGQAARSIYAGCIHPVLADNAQATLGGAGVTKLFGTDTIERSVSTVSVAPAIATELR